MFYIDDIRSFDSWRYKMTHTLTELQDWYWEEYSKGNMTKALKIYKLFNKMECEAIETEQSYCGMHGNVCWCPTIEGVVWLEGIHSKKKYNIN